MDKKEAFRAQRREWYRKNKARQHERRRLWYIQNAEKMRAYHKANRDKDLGAYRKRVREQKIRSPIPPIVAACKIRAKTNGIPFNITNADVVIPYFCPALGIPLKRTGGPRTDNSPSIDRIRNNLGYIKGNICVISWRANRIKNNCDGPEEFRKIADYMGRMTGAHVLQRVRPLPQGSQNLAGLHMDVHQVPETRIWLSQPYAEGFKSPALYALQEHQRWCLPTVHAQS